MSLDWEIDANPEPHGIRSNGTDLTHRLSTIKKYIEMPVTHLPTNMDISSEYDYLGLKAILSFTLTETQMLDH